MQATHPSKNPWWVGGNGIVTNRYEDYTEDRYDDDEDEYYDSEEISGIETAFEEIQYYNRDANWSHWGVVYVPAPSIANIIFRTRDRSAAP